MTHVTPICALIAGFAFSFSATAQEASNLNLNFQERPGLQEFTGRMIVRPLQVDALMAQGYSQSQAVAIREAARERLDGLVREYVTPNDEYVINLPEGMDEFNMATNLMATGDYQYAEPDWMLYPDATTPNDPQFSSQWWHQNINSENGWDFYTGDTSYISAVVDTGVDTNHPDLQANLISGYNSADRQTQANGGKVEDINGHGTWVMGCVGAIGNNNNQVAGVMWNSSLMPIRTTNSSGGGAYLSDLTNGALWAGQNGAGSVSVSYSGVESSSVGTTGTSLKNNYDCLMVWAAGNSGYALSSSADWANVIIVGATDQNNNKVSWSNYGAPLDLMAPGTSILTTQNGGGTGSPSGTSFSTPITQGAIALIRSYNTALSAQETEDILFGAATNIGTNFNTGNGLLNVEQNMIDAGGGGTTYDLTLTINGSLVGGTTASATVTGSVWTSKVYLFNGSGAGSSTIGFLGVTLDIANASQILSRTANSAGIADISKYLPNRLSGMTVYLQAADENARVSPVVVDSIL
jgi:subtilisin family serine protease